MSPRRAPANKGAKLHPEPLTQDEVGRLLKACSKRAPTGIRNRALIVLLYRGQLRINEALSLMPKDIDAKAGTIRVLNGKGNKSRADGLDDEAVCILDRCADRRKDLGMTGRQPFI